MANVQSELKKFLCLKPQPTKIRTKDPERIIEVGLRKGAWQEVERTIQAINPGAIELLDAAGGVIRACDLNDDGDDDEKKDKDADPMASNKHLAAVLDSHGKRMIEAFEAGVHASSSQQNHLVQLVEHLTKHLSHALTNLHHLSAQVATLQSAGGSADDAVAAKLIEAAMGGGGQLGLGSGSNGSNGKG